MSEFNKGAKYARDTILCLIIGLQNKSGNDVQSEQYKAYQEIYDAVVNNLGDMYKEFLL
jgi:hypothetical protein